MDGWSAHDDIGSMIMSEAVMERGKLFGEEEEEDEDEEAGEEGRIPPSHPPSRRPYQGLEDKGSGSGISFAVILVDYQLAQGLVASPRKSE
jgi:hypothetical protein